MNGRFQAIALVMLSVTSAFFSWLGAAVVGLVTLRKGAVEGGFLLLWGFLGGAFLYVKLGDVNPIMQLSGTFFLAVILRRTVNLAVAVLACVPLGLILILFLIWLLTNKMPTKGAWLGTLIAIIGTGLIFLY